MDCHVPALRYAMVAISVPKLRATLCSGVHDKPRETLAMGSPKMVLPMEAGDYGASVMSAISRAAGVGYAMSPGTLMAESFAEQGSFIAATTGVAAIVATTVKQARPLTQNGRPVSELLAGGCENAAKRIQKKLGRGEIIQVTGGGRSTLQVDGVATKWNDHVFVKDGDMVYDELTGLKGQSYELYIKRIEASGLELQFDKIIKK